MTLGKKLSNYSKKIYPMHMPGHKGGRYKLLEDIYSLDVTEVEGTDHLYHAEGILKDSMEELANFYGTKKTVYLVNGSTVGVLSAIDGLTVKGDEVLVARNCHQSVYHALSIKDLKPRYIYPQVTQWGLIGGISANELALCLSKNPKITVFIMTSPTYDGFISDIETIQIICKRYNVILVVDEAHGAHLPMSKDLPMSAVEHKADVVIHSMHKTLPTFTQTALMHLNLPLDLEARVMSALMKYQTSSPSYIMMAQIEACVKQLGNNSILWKKLLKDIEYVEKKANGLKKLYMVKEYSHKEEGIVEKDPLKSIILTRGSNINGQQLMRRLRHKYKIQMEMGTMIHSLGIITIADQQKALKKYIQAVKSIDRRLIKRSIEHKTYGIINAVSIERTPYEASECEVEWIEISEADGRICGAMITPYPPGIPTIVLGEKISESTIKSIIHWQNSEIEVLGIKDGRIPVIKK